MPMRREMARQMVVRGYETLVGGVAVRAKVAGVGDEDLVYDIVERTHQHGDDAWDGK